MNLPSDKIPHDWDSLTERDDAFETTRIPPPPDDREPQVLTLMASSWADLVGMLAVCTGSLVAVMALGQRPALAAFGWSLDEPFRAELWAERLLALGRQVVAAHG